MDQFTGPVRIVASLEERVHRIKLDRERSQGVGENVMDFSSDAVTLSQRRGAVAFGVGSHPLGEQLLGLHRSLDVLVPTDARHHCDDHEEGSLGDQCSGTPDHQGGHSLCRDADGTNADRREAAEGDRCTQPGHGHEHHCHRCHRR